MNGTLVATQVTDPTKLTEVSPLRTTQMPSFYYASDQTANQLAQILGGKVVQMPAFGQSKGWIEPQANFIQLQNGQTVNAADLAYYAKCGNQGVQQLTADLTACINEGAAATNYYQHGGIIPTFDVGYTGAAIVGQQYPAGTVAADGTVINPAMPKT
jgi:hypothetical protein